MLPRLSFWLYFSVLVPLARLYNMDYPKGLKKYSLQCGHASLNRGSLTMIPTLWNCSERPGSPTLA